MDESNPKRQRQEESFQQEEDSNSNSKRQKPYLVHNIFNLLDQEEDPQDPTQQDLSDIYTTLHKEISSDEFDFLSEPLTTANSDDGVESVMRHLLEASDDELGIPNTDAVVNSSDENVPVGFMDHGLWEFEDETANYYTFLQSQLLFEGFENENRVS